MWIEFLASAAPDAPPNDASHGWPVRLHRNHLLARDQKLRAIFASYSPTIACITSPNDRHRVYLSFQDRHGWQCQFLEADLKTPLPKRLHFTWSGKIIELVQRGGGLLDQESRLMLEQGIATGRGGVFPESDGGAVCETKTVSG